MDFSELFRQCYVVCKVVMLDFFQLVWDENQRKWVNRDGSSAEDVVVPPPPVSTSLPTTDMAENISKRTSLGFL